MLHHPKRTRMIERWSHWLAWLSLLNGGLSYVVLIALSLNSSEESSLTYVRFTEQIFTKAGMILNYLGPIISTAALFLLLMGVSLVTRLLRIYYTAISISK